MMAQETPAERRGRIAALLEQGLSLEDIAVTLRPAADSDSLRRAALLRELDEASLALALEGTGDDAAGRLAALQADGSLAAVADRPGGFVLRGDLRATLMKRWDVVLSPSSGTLTGRDVQLFRELHRRLAEHFAGRGAGFELSHLHHLLAADPEAGILRLKALLRERLPQPDEASRGATPAADAAAGSGLALARAFDVVETAEKQLPYLPPAGKEAYAAARRLVETWLDGSDAWYRTRRYIPRQQVHGWFFELLADDGPRILELHAPGGSGKTMCLRWLVACHSIPRRRPVAHLDFDQFLDRPQRPWELLLRCAEQLDRQVPGAPFSSLVKEGRNLQASLHGERGLTDGLDQNVLKAFEIEFPLRFRSILSSLASERVMIVIDTFEEAMVRGLTPVPAFIALLVDLLQAIPAQRLLVAGRYPLAHLGFDESLAKEFPDQSRFYQEHLRRERLPQFDRGEAAEYLARRGITLAPEQLDRVLDKAGQDFGGRRELSPFYLALLADLIEHRGPGQEIDDLLQDLDHVRLIHLIERIISRIDHVGVRWLVRYGSVPRKLSREFFDEVLVPHLQQVHQGSWREDDPAADPLPEPLRDEKLYFNQEDLLQNGAAALWERLRQFASSDSWVEEVEGGLKFHENAREPMLALLREHPVLRSIHRAASEFFAEKKAQAGAGEEILRLLREEVYHRFQWQGAGADPFLATLVEQEGDSENFQSVIALVEEIRADDYRPTAGPRWVSAGTLEKLQRRLIHAALAQTDLAATSQAAETCLLVARRALARIAELRGDEPADLTALAMVRETNPSRESLRAAAVVLEQAKPRTPELDRGLALAWRSLGDRRCVKALADLVALRRGEDKLRRRLTPYLIALLAEAQGYFGTDAESLEVLEAAVSTDQPERSVVKSVGRLLQVFRRSEASGAWVDRHGGPEDTDLHLIVVAAKARTQPLPAVKDLIYLRGLNALETSGGDETLGPRSWLLEAWIHALMADAGASVRALAQAADGFEAARRPAEAANCRLIEAQFWLHHHGDVSRSRTALERRQRSVNSGAGGESQRSLAERLLAFELELRSSGLETGGDELLAEAEASDFFEDRLACAMTLLSALPEASRNKNLERLAELLISTFERLPDALARSSFPWLLRDVLFTAKLGAAQEKRLLARLEIGKVPPLFGEEATVADRAWAHLAHSHLLRVVGRVDRAWPGLRYARDVFTNRESLTGLREVWHLEALFGQRYPVPADLAPLRGKAPSLEAAISIEQAEHALRRRDFAAALRWLDGIDPTRPDLRAGSFAARGEEARRAATRGQEGAAAMRGIESGLESVSKGAHAEPDEGSGALAVGPSAPSASALPGDETQPRQLDEAWGLHPRHVFDLGSAGPSPGLSHVWIEQLTGFAGSQWQSSLDLELVPGRRAAPHGLVEAFSQQPGKFAHEVFEEIVAPEIPTGLGLTLDLAFSGAHLAGAAVPWELGRHSRLDRAKRPLRLLYRQVANSAWRVYWLQRALRAAAFEGVPRSGKWDLATDDALRRFGNQQGTGDLAKLKEELRGIVAQSYSGDPRRVALLQPRESAETVSQRGLGFGGAELPKLYERHGFRCEVLRGVGLADLFRAGEGFAFDLVHVYAPYIESRSGGDVGPDLDPKSSSFSSFTDLRRRVPLLILDGPGEPGLQEQVRQIFLRNAAASLLARTPHFPNILALGLEPQPNFELLEALFEKIRRGASFYELYQTVAEPMPAVMPEVLHYEAGRLAPALWSADPELSVIPGSPEEGWG